MTEPIAPEPEDEPTTSGSDTASAEPAGASELAEPAASEPADPAEPAAATEPSAAQPAAAQAAGTVPPGAVAVGAVPPGAQPGAVPLWTVGPQGQPVRVAPGQLPPGLVWPGAPRTPPKPSLMERHWPGPSKEEGARRATLSAIFVAALVGAVSIVLNRPGFGWLLTGLAVAGAVVVTNYAVRDRDPWTFRNIGERVFWGLAALALLEIGTVRDSGWLFFLCVVTALGCGAMALAGGRTVKGLALALITWIGAVFRSPAWLVRGVKAARTDRSGPRVVLAIVMSVALLLIFGGLFAAADAEFAHVLGSVLPKWTAGDVVEAIFCFAVILGLTCGATYLAAARPSYAKIPSSTRNPVRRIEWALPLTVLNLLFAIFVYIQLTVLFGGPSVNTRSHAYMRGYAHSGFWQLVVVSLLTLTVIGVTCRVASRETGADRISLRLLLGGLSVFSIVIVASAIKRLGAYEHAFGYTRVRVVVGGFELWLGAVFVLVLIAGIRVKASWLPQVIAGSFVVALLVGAIANPDLYVANRNVDRYQQTGKFSVEYMRQLSADAVPAIQRLPEKLRDCSMVDIAERLAEKPDYWRTWNFSRVDARKSIGVFDESTARGCPSKVSRPD
jgi:Domain of unknown function (DUF4153)